MPLKAVLLLVLASASVLLPLLKAEERGVRAQCIGGTISQLSKNSEGRIELSDERVMLFRSSHADLGIPYNKVNVVEYGQRVNRRYAAAVLISPVLLLSKSRKHFVTVGYTDERGVQQALVFQVHKADVRSLLAGLEARTGRRVEYQDDEARKSGKG